ncbi:hypothetical protein OGATHE_005836 [Ogataea polymorpha]|uniref:Uncharacterized protein n=1 Tax=Ogataea polymorpha TaxID=460523 RepID=A0A9P8SYX4_9ASCO|nr:hypothetical protein OGATHE_005836 [Ogataea polymorpha]
MASKSLLVSFDSFNTVFLLLLVQKPCFNRQVWNVHQRDETQNDSDNPSDNIQHSPGVKRVVAGTVHCKAISDSCSQKRTETLKPPPDTGTHELLALPVPLTGEKNIRWVHEAFENSQDDSTGKKPGSISAGSVTHQHNTPDHDCCSQSFGKRKLLQ